MRWCTGDMQAQADPHAGHGPADWPCARRSVHERAEVAALHAHVTAPLSKSLNEKREGKFVNER